MEGDTETSNEAGLQAVKLEFNTQHSTTTNDLTCFLVGWCKHGH